MVLLGGVKGAFSYCKSLKEVKFEEGSKLKSIGNGAFERCGKLENIAIPASVKEIGAWAFFNCKKLLEVTLEEGSQLQNIDTFAFRYCEKLEKITIPASVISMLCSTFENCKNLKEVKFEEDSQLQNIGDAAFEKCKKLENITIPFSVKSIGTNTFKGCGSINIYCEGMPSSRVWYKKWWGNSKANVIWNCKNKPTQQPEIQEEENYKE